MRPFSIHENKSDLPEYRPDETGEVKAVLDIDSPKLNRFTEEDRQGLEAFAHEIERAMKGL